MSIVPEIDFSPLASLGQIYQKAKNEATLGQLGQGISDGSVDYQKAAGMAAQAGRLDLTMSLLDLARKQKASEQFNQLAPLLAGGGQPQPAAQPQAAAPAGISERIVGAESGGVSSATNPRSSAAGPGQFIDSTWLETVKRARPDLAAGKSDAAILAMRTDPAFAGLSQAMTGEYAKQNAGVLAESGQPQTPGNIYLAHFAGPTGATKILSADPATPVTSILSPQAIQANPQIANMTAGELRAWADRKMGSEPAPYQVAQAGGGPVPVPAAGAPPAPQAAQPGGPPMPATSNVSRSIPLLLQMVANPGLDKPQQEAAKVLLEHALKTSDLPEAQKNYVLYRSQGGNLPFFEYEKQLKTAGATMINTAEGLDAAQAKARIAIDTHAIQDLSKKVVAGRASLPLLDRVMSIADKTPGGWAGTVSPTIAKALSSFGIPVPEGISNAELMISMSRQFIPAIRDPGSASNLEQSLYAQAVPGLAQSPEGRLKIASMMRSQIERQAEIMQIYRENVGSPNLDKKLAELDAKPVFSPDDRKYLERFAKAEPPAGGAQAGPAPPQAIEALRGNPSLRDQFDAKYGAGASDRALGGAQ